MLLSSGYGGAPRPGAPPARSLHAVCGGKELSMFNIGEKVIYAQMGVCEIMDITVPSFCERGAERRYYVLAPDGHSGSIFVPVDANVYMRKLLSREEANQLIDMIPDVRTRTFDNAGVQELKQHYADAMQSHDCGELIELVMSIYAKNQARIKSNRKIGSIDENAMRRAEELLYGEFAAALDIPKESVPKYIAKRLRTQNASAAEK